MEELEQKPHCGSFSRPDPSWCPSFGKCVECSICGQTEAKTWRCFFCDEVFYTVQAAKEHFGSNDLEENYLPGCIDPLRKDEKERINYLRNAEAYALQCQKEAEAAEERADIAEYELQQIYKKFGDGCNSAWVVCDRYDNLLFEIKTLREKQNRELSI